MDEALKNAVLTGRYSVTEEPEVFSTSANCFRYFPGSQTLLVSTQDYTDNYGRVRMGKTVSVKLAGLISEPATLKALYRVLGACRDKVEKEVWSRTE